MRGTAPHHRRLLTGHTADGPAVAAAAAALSTGDGARRGGMHGTRLARAPQGSGTRLRRLRRCCVRIDRLVGTGNSGPAGPLRLTLAPAILSRLSPARPSWRTVGASAFRSGSSGGRLAMRRHAPRRRRRGIRDRSRPRPHRLLPYKVRRRSGRVSRRRSRSEQRGLRPQRGEAGRVMTAGATGAGFSTGRSRTGGRLGCGGRSAGPAAAGGATGLGGAGGGGATTTLRAVALISAIERVSGWASAARSWIFFRSSPRCTAGVSPPMQVRVARCGGSGRRSLFFRWQHSPPARKCASDFVREVVIERTGVRFLVLNTQLPSSIRQQDCSSLPVRVPVR